MQNIEQAIAVHKEGDFKQAEKLYLAILHGNPNDANALHLLGLLHHDQGDLSQAVELVDKAIEQQPDEGLYRNTLGCVYQKMNKWHKAQGCFKKAIELNPNLATAYNNLGYCFLREFKLDSALEMFELALRLEEDFLDALINISNVLLEQDKPEQAFVYINRAIKLDSKSPAVLTNYGRALCQQGKPGLALECFQKILAKTPGLFFTKSLLGNAQLGLGHIEDARLTFEQNIQDHPDRSEVYADMAELLFKTNQLNEALEYLLVAIKKPGAHKKTFEKTAATAYQLSQYDLARRCLEFLVKQLPEHAYYHFKLGQVQAAAKHYEAALVAFNNAIEKERSLTIPAYLVMAEIYQYQHQHEKAIELANQILATDENNHKAMLILAREALYNGIFEQAIGWCNKVLESENDVMETLKIKAKSLDGLSQFDQAAECFVKANAAIKQHKSAIEQYASNLDKRIEQLSLQKSIESIDFSAMDFYPKPVFIIGFPGSGFQLIAKVLDAHTKVNVLFDRLSKTVYRHDCFLRHRPNELSQLSEAAILLERKRYWQHVDRMLTEKKQPVVFDLIPFQIAAPEIIHCFFPEATVVWVQRDFASIKLHNLATGLGQGLTVAECSKLAKQFNKLHVVAERQLNLEYLPIMLKIDADAEKNTSALLTCFELNFEQSMQKTYKQAKLDRFGINKYFPDNHNKNYLSYLDEYAN